MQKKRGATTSKTTRAEKGSNLVQITRTSLKNLDRKTREQWGRHLHQLMKQKGLSQSELAEATFGKDATGEVLGRDRISKYISGKSFPERDTIDKLCIALEIRQLELLSSPILNALETINVSPIVLDVYPEKDLCHVKFSGAFRIGFMDRLIKLMIEFNPDIAKNYPKSMSK